jgi:hypothetical protein
LIEAPERSKSGSGVHECRNLSESNGAIITNGVAREEEGLKLVHLDEVGSETFSSSDSDCITVKGESRKGGVQTIPD